MPLTSISGVGGIDWMNKLNAFIAAVNALTSPFTVSTSAQAIAGTDNVTATSPLALAAVIAKLTPISFVGKNLAGACTLTGAKVGDTVVSVTGLISKRLHGVSSSQEIKEFKMPFSNGPQAGAHVVTTAEATASSATFSLNMVFPSHYEAHMVTAAGVPVTLIGATITMTVGTETSGVWSNATLTVANALTAGNIIYWLAM
jgi:hypothetical protein